MKLKFIILLLIIFAFVISANASKQYRLYGSYLSLIHVEYDTFTDPRDGRSYKVYKVEKHFTTTICSDMEYCTDTAFVYIFAENIQYKTTHSVCHHDGCNQYGRYYPIEEVDSVCPSGWSIPTSEDANVIDFIVFDRDTIYGTSDRYIRKIHSQDFPADGIKITDRYASLDDFPSGWFSSTDKHIINSGKIGTIWTSKENTYYPSFIDFNILSYDDMNALIQEETINTPGNMFPIKCHKVVFTRPKSNSNIVPRTLDIGLYSSDEF